MIDLGGKIFTKKLWKARLCPATVGKVMDLRSRYNTIVDTGYKGKEKWLWIMCCVIVAP